jgi:DUF4097 and DUF4098 domain-containing protein YvlB
MDFRSSRQTATVSMLILLSAICHGGTITQEFSKIYDFDGKNVVVKTNNGSIFVESWDNDRVRVDAEIQVRSGSKQSARDFMEKVKVVVQQQRDDLVITVDQPASQGSSFVDWIFGAGKPSVSVDFEIKVPEKMNVSAFSVNGSVETVGINGSTVLSTTNGKISAEEMTGSVKAEGTNGSISIDLVSVQDDDNVVLHTVNGNIVLTLASKLGADIRASTVNGSIRTDFPLEIKGEWGPKNISGKMNGGGAHFKVETVNGSVAIEER